MQIHLTKPYQKFASKTTVERLLSVLLLIELEGIVFAVDSSFSILIITPFHAPESSHVGIPFYRFVYLRLFLQHIHLAVVHTKSVRRNSHKFLRINPKTIVVFKERLRIINSSCC